MKTIQLYELDELEQKAREKALQELKYFIDTNFSSFYMDLELMAENLLENHDLNIENMILETNYDKVYFNFTLELNHAKVLTILQTIFPDYKYEELLKKLDENKNLDLTIERKKYRNYYFYDEFKYADSEDVYSQYLLNTLEKYFCRIREEITDDLNKELKYLNSDNFLYDYLEVNEIQFTNSGTIFKNEV